MSEISYKPYYAEESLKKPLLTAGCTLAGRLLGITALLSGILSHVGAFPHSALGSTLTSLSTAYKWTLIGGGSALLSMSLSVRNLLSVYLWKKFQRRFDEFITYEPPRMAEPPIEEEKEDEHFYAHLSQRNHQIQEQDKICQREELEKEERFRLLEWQKEYRGYLKNHPEPKVPKGEPYLKHYSRIPTKSSKVIRRAAAMRKVLQETDYVFTHAQSSVFYPLLKAMKYVAREYLNLHASSFTYLRFPWDCTQEPHFFNLDTVHDHIFREDLLSVDLMKNRNINESSLYFFSRNANIWCDTTTLFQKLFFHLSLNLFGKDLNNEVYTEDAIQRLQKLAAISGTGHLILIALPKEEVRKQGDQILYKSHPVGRRCRCYPEEEELSLLDDLQNNRKVDEKNCGSQYRLLVRRFTPEMGGRSFIVSSLTQTERKEIKKQIATIFSTWEEIARASV